MNKIRLPRDAECDLEFEGELVASCSSDPTGFGPRWTELKLYQTKGGAYVAQAVGRSTFEGERTLSSCKVCPSMTAAAEFFKVDGKVTWLSKKMYDEMKKHQASFDFIEKVE